MYNSDILKSNQVTTTSRCTAWKVYKQGPEKTPHLDTQWCLCVKGSKGPYALSN